MFHFSLSALEMLFLLCEIWLPSTCSSDLSLKDLFSRKPFLPLRGWINSSFLCTLIKACAHLYYSPGLPVSSLDCNYRQFYSTVEHSYFSEFLVYPTHSMNDCCRNEYMSEWRNEQTWMNEWMDEWNILQSIEGMTYFIRKDFTEKTEIFFGTLSIL